MSSADELSVLRDCGALSDGHFVLASGKHSGHYIQVARIGARPSLLAKLLGEGASELAGQNIATVFGAAIGGIVVGYQLAALLGCRSIFAERGKDNRLTLRRGFSLAQGERILLLEDVVTTGGTLAELRAIADEQGATIVGAYTLINRSGSERWQELSLRSRFALSFPVYQASDCPLCAAGLPPIRPGSKAVDL